MALNTSRIFKQNMDFLHLFLAVICSGEQSGAQLRQRNQDKMRGKMSNSDLLKNMKNGTCELASN